MNILCINTCLKTCYVAMICDDKIFESINNDKLQHSVLLMQQIENVVDMANIELKEIDYIAVCIGTGSFTGIRVGLAVAKGLANSLNIKLIPIDTLSVLAYNTLNDCKYVVMKGVSDEYFVADVQSSRCINERLMHKSQLDDIINSDDWIATFDDLDFDCNIEKIDNLSMQKIAVDYLDKATQPNLVQPVYLRLSQAEMQKREKDDKNN